MKFTLAVVFIGAVVTASYVAPATNAVDWDGISSQVQGIQSKIQANFRRASEIAKGNNPSIIGTIIEDKLEARIAEAGLIFDQVNTAVSDRSLTEPLVKEHLDNVQTIVRNSFTDVHEDINRLSVHIRTTILDLISHTTVDVMELSFEIYDLLRQ